MNCELETAQGALGAWKEFAPFPPKDLHHTIDAPPSQINGCLDESLAHNKPSMVSI